MLAIVSSNVVIIAVVAGIPAVVAVLVVLWSLPRRPSVVVGVASVLAIALVAVTVWAVFRPTTQTAAAGPSIPTVPSIPAPSLPSTGSPPAPGGACSPSGTNLELTAKGIAFDKTCLAAPAQTTFTLAFDNQDAGTLHNVHILAGDPASNPGAQSLFTGQFVTGVATTDYKVGALPPGTYYFQCDVHPPQMHGTFVVK